VLHYYNSCGTEFDVSEHDFSRLRAAMVSNQLRTNAVTDIAILAALDAVERDRFVPADRAALAYVDVPVPLANGRSLNAPLVTARLIQDAHVEAGSIVLLVGAATGYAAALLARLGCTVTALESDAALAATARTNLEGTGVAVVEGAMDSGHAASAPYDAIMIDGAVDAVPAALWDQLKEGGRIVSAWNDRGVSRLVRGLKTGGSTAMIPFLEVEAVALPGFAAPQGFKF
jgi:protein-L-isoaspartate(D-aspartate) O-methyltransferase